MTVSFVFVHGIRTSATMWRAQTVHARAHGWDSIAVDLPGHGTRMAEPFTIDGALDTIATAIRRARDDAGTVILVGHSMGGLLSLAGFGRDEPPEVDAVIAASCTVVPRGMGLATYRLLARGLDSLPGRGLWISQRVLQATLPEDTRDDFGAGGYALDAQDVALRSLGQLDIMRSLSRISVPTWFVNGQYDQLRVHEQAFIRAVPGSELIVVPRTSHLITAMRPAVFNALMNLAVATVESARS